MTVQDTWTAIHNGMTGKRNILIERDSNASLRVVTTALGSDEEIAIHGETPEQLEDRLVVYGQFTEAQAAHILRKILLQPE